MTLKERVHAYVNWLFRSGNDGDSDESPVTLLTDSGFDEGFNIIRQECEKRILAVSASDKASEWKCGYIEALVYMKSLPETLLTGRAVLITKMSGEAEKSKKPHPRLLEP